MDNNKIKMLSGKNQWRTCDNENDGVKSIFVADGPNGLRKVKNDLIDLYQESIVSVCYPAACCFASSFDKSLANKLGQTLGNECLAEGVDILLGPAINIKRSPLCGRNFEYVSEDPYLAGTISASYINGVQSKGVGTSVKHFAANNQETRRMCIDAKIEERALHEIYLKGFEIAVKTSNPYTIMCSYNKINGVYSSENKWLLTDILRNEWGFKGFVMSDWGAVNRRYMGVLAGLDLEMPSSTGLGENDIKKALNRGDLKDSDVDTCYNRIAKISNKIVNDRTEYKLNKEEHHEIAKEIAANSMVLLKNENNVLPIKKSKKVAFIGEFAKKPRYQGGGSAHINTYKVVSALDCAENVSYAQGFKIDEDKSDLDLETQAVELAKTVDTAVVFVGLPERYESEGFDRKSMEIPYNQNRLVKLISGVCKNVVVVLQNGSPVEMPWINEVKGVFEMYLAGEAGSQALVDILFGKTNPSGKLAETFPISLSDNPSYYNFPGNEHIVEYREGIFVGYRYYEKFNKDVLFPFGHGLSYSKFKYSGLKLSKKSLKNGESITATISIKNESKIDGAEVVELYIGANDSNIVRPVKEFKGFEKVFLKAGEEKTVSFEINEEILSVYQNGFKVENCEYTVFVGASSKDIKETATFKTTGFCDFEKQETEIVDVKYLSRTDFEKQLGTKIVFEEFHKPYSRDNCIGDIKDSVAGKIANKAIDIMMPESDMNWDRSFALEMPIHTMAAMSLGSINDKNLPYLENILNDKRPITNLTKFGVVAGLSAVKKLIIKK